MQDILRVAAAAPSLKIANVDHNLHVLRETIRQARTGGAKILVLPELCLTGATCGDLIFQQSLLSRVTAAIETLCDVPELDGSMLVAVGAPLCVGDQLFDCAILLGDHRVLAVTPKTYLTRADQRWYTSAADLPPQTDTVRIGRYTAPFGAHLIVETVDGLKLTMEVGEDLYAPLPPSAVTTLGGASLVLNPAAMGEVITGREYREALIRQTSARALTAYVYASAGADESTSDLLFSGHCMIADGGTTLAETDQHITRSALIFADIDTARDLIDRRRSVAFRDSAALSARHISCRRIAADTVTLLSEDAPADLLTVDKLPFIPSTHAERTARCLRIFDMQAQALARRLETVRGKAVIGISGGLDSTLALLVAIRAAEIMGRPRADVIGITMPCFGTTDHTLNNSLKLMEGLGITYRTVPIAKSVLRHFEDIGHDPKDYSVTYENAQARERTQVLMDIANREGGIVVGTGDLSELALGWCTYNADHMSMYGVNAGVPKTLVRWVITAACDSELFPEVTEVLRSVLDTPISPELLPPDAAGKIAQITEDLVGPYALHDFFLYYVLRFGFAPRKIYDLACTAFRDDFDAATVKKWLITFYRRFFTQQFKRNCLPDGVKIGTIGLSPRGDWAMPADADFRLWVTLAEQL